MDNARAGEGGESLLEGAAGEGGGIAGAGSTTGSNVCTSASAISYRSRASVSAIDGERCAMGEVGRALKGVVRNREADAWGPSPKGFEWGPLY